MCTTDLAPKKWHDMSELLSLETPYHKKSNSTNNKIDQYGLEQVLGGLLVLFKALITGLKSTS